MKFNTLENNAEQMRRKQEALREQARVRQGKVSAARRRAISWSPEQLKRALGPMVYIWWGRDQEHPLYIGMSAVGISRAIRDHNYANPRDAIRMEFICCESADAASELERDLIRIMKPQHNKRRY